VARLLACIAVMAGCGYPPLADDGPGTDGGPQPSCQANASYGSTLFLQQAEYSNGDNVILYDGDLNQDAAPDRVRIEIYGDNFPGHTIDTGSFPITGTRLDGANCDVCVLIAANCQGCTLDSGDPASWYMATGGEIDITDASEGQSSGSIAGTLSNVTFTHVTRNDTDGATTPVNDGCASKIASLSFSSTVTIVN
jgi:hypothetical protein